MENKQGYDPSEFEDDDYTTPQPDAGKSIRGYRIVIIILSVILAALSVLYFSIHRQQMLDNELLQADRDSIQNDLGRLMTDYDGLRISNDSISAGLTLERERADSLMTRLKKERSWNLAKIKQYEKEVGTLRTIMKGYVKQIDSLNTLNKKLIKENVGFRKEISSAKLRADMAEEKAAELDNKVKVGSVLRARDIRLSALNDRSKPVSRQPPSVAHVRNSHRRRAAVRRLFFREPLCLQLYVLPVGRHEVTARGGGGDVADDVHKAQPHDLLLHRKRHGEEQFVVLAAV